MCVNTARRHFENSLILNEKICVLNGEPLFVIQVWEINYVTILVLCRASLC